MSVTVASAQAQNVMSVESTGPSTQAPEVMPMERPGHGDRGRKVHIRTNFFEVKNMGTCEEFIIYNIDIKAVNASDTIQASIKRERSDYGRQIRRRVFKELGLLRGDWFNGVVVGYDGGPVMYCTRRLDFDRDTDNTPMETETITLADMQDLDGKGTEYKVFIVRKQDGEDVARLSDLRSYLDGDEFRWEFFDDNALKAFNALIHQNPAENFAQYGRSSIFDKGNRVLIDGGVELWSGWFGSVRPGEGKLFVNVNPTYTCFYQPLRLPLFIQKFMEHRRLPVGKSDTPITEIARVEVNRVLRNLLVRPINMKGVVSHQRISEISKTLGPQYMAKPSKNSDEQVQLINYLREKFDFNHLRFKHVVTLKITDGVNIAWPIELCEIVEGQRYSNNKLSSRQRAEILTKSTMKPQRKMEETLKGARDVYNLQKDPLLNEAGIKISTDPVIVPGRVLPAPQIQYHQSGKSRVVNPAGGSWNLRDVRFAEPGEDLKKWEIAVFDQKDGSAEELVRTLVKQCGLQGMQISNRNPGIAYYRPDGNLDNAVKHVYTTAKQRLGAEPQMLLFVLPSEKAPHNLNSELYKSVKKVMDTQLGVLTQCVTSDHKDRFRNPQYCANVAMKMNLKLGGINSKLDEKVLCLPNRGDVLFLGADVTHFTVKTTPSICAVVGSLDNQGARFITKYRGQERTGQEEIREIGAMVREILDDYVAYQQRRKNPRAMPPNSIIMYRDGVSDSQYRSVLAFELREIQEACRNFGKGYNPKITFAVVGKRHHTRLFPANQKDGDRNGNAPVGTIVDSVITSPSLNDFYLQSHYSLQGTARCSHYTILYDENDCSVNDFQELSNRLCYNFQRATRAVSIPGPTYYAHLTAYRARNYLTPPHGEDLRKLYPLHPRFKNYPMYFV